MAKESYKRNQKRPPKPLDPRAFEELALGYVARFATSAARLEGYLARKLRERGWSGEGQPDVAGTVARLVGLGYIDDEAYARARSGGLLRRGYGQRRIGQALYAAGIDEEVREAVRPAPGEARAAALAMARKRRFGPYGQPGLDRTVREKQVAAMLRAGHPLDSARQLVDAASVEAAEAWAAEAED
ncbi:MAG TPA: RecX family transcriptional regulator [Croceibacterium sp.]|nr:RecX family transcriptional regulator [Croceibacterium sp.]